MLTVRTPAASSGSRAAGRRSGPHRTPRCLPRRANGRATGRRPTPSTPVTRIALAGRCWLRTLLIASPAARRCSVSVPNTVWMNGRGPQVRGDAARLQLRRRTGRSRRPSRRPDRGRGSAAAGTADRRSATRGTSAGASSSSGSGVACDDEVGIPMAPPSRPSAHAVVVHVSTSANVAALGQLADVDDEAGVVRGRARARPTCRAPSPAPTSRSRRATVWMCVRSANMRPFSCSYVHVVDAPPVPVVVVALGSTQ